MKRFLKQEKGDSMMLMLFIIPLFVMMAIVVLAVGNVYFAENHARSLLERTTSITVDDVQANNTVRDLVFSVSESSAEGIIEQRLIDAGLIGQENTYTYSDIYSISNLTYNASGDTLIINATINVNMPWRLSDAFSVVSLPMEIQSHILFLEN